MLPFPEAETAATLPKEGIPYWLFYLLLCVIFLLLAALFLRDKALRQRVNFFFFGARRRLERLQAIMKLRKEREKRRVLLRRLGEVAWSENILTENCLSVASALRALQARERQCREKLQEEEGNARSRQTKAAPVGDIQKLLREEIKGLQEVLAAHFEELGMLLCEQKPAHASLSPLFSDLEEVEKTMRDLEAQIKNL